MFDKLIDLFKQFGRIFVFWYVADPYEGGVVLRLGKFHRMISMGLNWIIPFSAERVLLANCATHTLIVGPQSLMTKDGRQVVLSCVVTCTVEDPKAFILEINGGMAALDDASAGVVSKLIMDHTLPELQAMDISNELTKDVRRFSKPWGIAITRVQLIDFTLTRSIRLLQSIAQTYPERKEF